ncbi:MAG: T9SS type A sorting domain-containing protein [Flavobacteriales bacterium]
MTMMTRTIACCLFAPALSTAVAQYPLVGSFNGYSLHTLETAGQKLFSYTAAQITIYNLDLTTYASFNLPPPPANHTFNMVGYITEDLFDTDPTTIECMVYYSTSNPYTPATRVYRFDGTLLFEEIPGRPSGAVIGGVASWPIFNSDSGTYMLISETATGTKVYQLPGHMPCATDCAGALITGGGESFAPDPGTAVFMFPNPSDAGTEVVYQLPDGTRTADLFFYNTAGQKVLQVPVDNSTDRVHVSTSMLAAGTYLYQLRTGTEVIGGPRLVVVH